MVPVGQTSVYRVLGLYKANQLNHDATWTGLSQSGQKSLLSPKGFNALVSIVQQKSQGGCSTPMSMIKDLVKEKIESEHCSIHGKNSTPTVTDLTLSNYASCIMADGGFNIHIGKMPYKTQNHSTAEWSKRSVISYNLAVAATHFFDVEPSPYHMKKSKIDESSREL